MSNPTTYAAAFPKAELVTFTEFQDLLDASQGGLTILRPRSRRRHSIGSVRLRLRPNPRWDYISYEYCNRKGYGATGCVTIEEVVFDFYHAGRLVRVARRHVAEDVVS